MFHSFFFSPLARSKYLTSCNFFHVFYPFDFSIIFFLFPYFTLELFYFLCLWLLVCPCTFFTNLLVEFSFIILEGSILFVLFEPVPVSFESPFFHQYPFISSSHIVRLVWCVVLVISFQLILMCFAFLSSFACCSFIIYPFSLISHSGFIFLFKFLRGILVSSLTSFVPA